MGAIGFEPSALKQTEVLAGLGWHLKDRNGSQRNNYWTRIGHCRLPKSLERLFARAPEALPFDKNHIRRQLRESSPRSEFYKTIREELKRVVPLEDGDLRE